MHPLVEYWSTLSADVSANSQLTESWPTSRPTDQLIVLVVCWPIVSRLIYWLPTDIWPILHWYLVDGIFLSTQIFVVTKSMQQFLRGFGGFHQPNVRVSSVCAIFFGKNWGHYGIAFQRYYTLYIIPQTVYQYSTDNWHSLYRLRVDRYT